MCHKLVTAVYDFIQATDHSLTPSARELALFYAHHTRGGRAYHSNAFISSRSGMSVPSISRARKELVAAGLLIEIRGRRRTAEFQLTFKPCATSSECRVQTNQDDEQINKSEINKNNISNLSANAPLPEKLNPPQLIKKSPPPVNRSVSPRTGFKPKVDYSGLYALIGEPEAIAWKENYRQRKGGKMNPTQWVVDGMVTQLLMAQRPPVPAHRGPESRCHWCR